MTEELYGELYRQNVAAMRDQLLTQARVSRCRPEDLEQLESIYFAFFWEGPEPALLDVADRSVRAAGSAANFPTYEELMMQTDWDGSRRGYLASEENFRRSSRRCRSAT